MKEKLKDNATLAEKFDFLAKCARHKEKGGFIINDKGYGVILENVSAEYSHLIIIQHEPKFEYVPYTAGTFPSDWNTRIALSKISGNKYVITGVLKNGVVIDDTSESFKSFYTLYVWSDGSVCGVKKEVV